MSLVSIFPVYLAISFMNVYSLSILHQTLKLAIYPDPNDGC